MWLYEHFCLLQQNEVAVNEIIVLETVLSINCRCHIVSAVEILTYLVSRSQPPPSPPPLPLISKSPLQILSLLRSSIEIPLPVVVFTSGNI